MNMKLSSVVICALSVAAVPLLAQRGRAGGSGAGADALSGDAANGKALVESSKCLTCHRIGETGSRVGPDLSTIGALRSPEQLRQAIVTPDADVPPEDRYARIVTKDGATVTGRLLNQDTFTIQIMSDKEELKSFARTSLREYTILDKGLMPAYEGKLTPQQIDDVVNYLASLKPILPAGRNGGRQ
jgi:putative heme-binding domain-containing protein